jgi:hypothetical protein
MVGRSSTITGPLASSRGRSQSHGSWSQVEREGDALTSHTLTRVIVEPEEIPAETAPASLSQQRSPSRARILIALNLPAAAIASFVLTDIALRVPFPRTDRIIVWVWLAAVYAGLLTGAHVLIRILARIGSLRARLGAGLIVEWFLFLGFFTLNALFASFGYRDMRWTERPFLTTLSRPVELALTAGALLLLYAGLRKIPWHRVYRWAPVTLLALVIVPLLPVDKTRAHTPASAPAVLQSPLARSANSRLILVGLDGVDPKLLDALIASGQLRAFPELIDQGFRARFDNDDFGLSPAVWTSLATGVARDRHGLRDFVTTTAPGLSHSLDACLEVIPAGFGIKSIFNGLKRAGVIRTRPMLSTDRRQVALWQVLSYYGRSTFLVNYFNTYPADLTSGASFASGFLTAFHTHPAKAAASGYVHPESWVDVLPARRPAASRRTGAPSARDVLVFDSSSFEELESVFFKGMQRQPFEFAAFYTSWTDGFNHALSPAEYDAILEGRFETPLTREFVLTYKRIDAFLLELRRSQPDADIVIVSDHGVREGFTLKRRILQHLVDAPGIVIAHGPHVVRGTADRVSVYDIAPTLLRFFEVPVAADLDGKVDARFLQLPAATEIATYNGVIPDRKVPARATGDLDRALLDRLRALGYVE